MTGSVSGKGGNAATLGVDEKTELRALTVDFHEPGFSNELGKENRFTTQKGFRFQLDNQDLQLARISCGPLNPQALNRYSYVLNNPLRYTDPTGHYDNSSNTSGDAGYAQQCTNGYGEQGDCNDAQGYSNPITVETTDSTGKVKFKHNYMRVWHSGSSKYGYTGDAGIDGFMSSLGNFNGVEGNLITALIAAGVTSVTAIIGCVATSGAGCVIGLVGDAVAAINLIVAAIAFFNANNDLDSKFKAVQN